MLCYPRQQFGACFIFNAFHRYTKGKGFGFFAGLRFGCSIGQNARGWKFQ
jgi:hypothetical protein